MKMAMPPIIEVQDVTTCFGSRTILQDINLTVHPGEIMVVMGGSGSGKSTLLRHLIGLEHVTSGFVRLFGNDLSHITDHELSQIYRKLGVAFQGGALFSSMTVGENIMLPLDEHTDLDHNTKTIMMRMKLEVVNLSGVENLLPSELSGGMLKRAAFARAVIMDPALLFCDEPSAGLDPVASSSLDELILKLRDALNMTIVVVTHELESAFRIADRITVLDKGQILMTGSVEEVRASSNTRIQDLLNRRFHEESIDPERYLARLTDEIL